MKYNFTGILLLTLHFMNTSSELTLQQIVDNWHITKPTLYNRIKAGGLARLPNKKILLTEFLRAFPDVKPKSKETENKVKFYGNFTESPEFVRLEVENKFLREKIESIEKREIELTKDKELFRKLFEDASDRVKLLEAPQTTKQNEPTYTPPPQHITNYNQWEEDQQHKEQSTFEKIIRRFF